VKFGRGVVGVGIGGKNWVKQIFTQSLAAGIDAAIIAIEYIEYFTAFEF